MKIPPLLNWPTFSSYSYTSDSPKHLKLYQVVGLTLHVYFFDLGCSWSTWLIRDDFVSKKLRHFLHMKSFPAGFISSTACSIPELLRWLLRPLFIFCFSAKVWGCVESSDSVSLSILAKMFRLKFTLIEVVLTMDKQWMNSTVYRIN